ncbi:MAG: bifunctional methylenetetrahydrofolate dehydrogenase/methenyltetrahydrofolate cyclohydrolase FolD [Deltaproteobacteria bacterium]|nr:bifunctional methylenetetrahydrofolate dehydrogenase/methenyltetrahydrofolate cyclohydrolase FolD [Deltaproteobacteria bacterium]
MAQLIDGKLVSQKIKTELKIKVDEFIKQTGIQPGLATVLVGDNEASRIYVKNKIKGTEDSGMRSIHRQCPQGITEAELLTLINTLNGDPSVHGILVQLPLPAHISSDKIIRAINPSKDVDGFHPYNIGLLMTGHAALKPCTPLGIMELLKHYSITASGRDCVVIGRSNIVGKPQAIMMTHENATVTVCHSKTQNLPEKVRSADIVIAAMGRAKFVKGDWIKRGAVVIDVGMNRDENGKLCGDVDFDEAQKRAAYITPVPGGVGPMTIAMLLVNTLKAAAELGKVLPT